MLAQGLETGAFGARDLVRAHDWYERAALAGSADAQQAMGTAYYLGRGRPHDAVRAAHWYREAALRGDVGAMYLLASMYEHGEGVEPDPRLARHWYELAARHGDVAAPGKLQELDARAATARP
jgi:TPR repeat protein